MYAIQDISQVYSNIENREQTFSQYYRPHSRSRCKLSSARINLYTGITVRGKVRFTHSPGRSLYYVCCWCLQLLVARMTISDEGWLDDKTGGARVFVSQLKRSTAQCIAWHARQIFPNLSSLSKRNSYENIINEKSTKLDAFFKIFNMYP